MRAIPILAAALLLAAAGCVTPDPEAAGPFRAQEPDPSANATATPEASTPTPEPSPDAETAKPPTLVLDYGLVGGNVTTANESIYYVNASLPVTASLVLDGIEFSPATFQGNHTWSLPLDYGQASFEATITTSEGTATDARMLVRLAATTFIVDYCHYHPDKPAGKRDNVTVWIDIDARPSLAFYVDRPRPDTFTAHDQLETWRNDTGIAVEYSYFDDFGYAVDSIDGVGNSVSSSAPPYWLYRVNGEDAQEGISTQPVVPGDVVEWRASNLGPPCE